MQGAKHIIISSDKDRDLHMISGINLCGLIYKVMSIMKILEEMMLKLVEITVRGPTISIKDSNKDIV